ncbi:biopolymer transporter ExbD [Porticoccaceae bacterium]|nr:biopolymer transporter ExbD [Porticoccaceae bacterium]
MKFRRQGKMDNGLNLTPLIDVVFLLLIFFMVTTTFSKETGLMIKLPEASGMPVVEMPDMLDLVISSDGDYSLNGKGLINREIGTIMAALNDASAGDISVPLIITADANSSHQSVITALDAASKLGFNTLHIATQQPFEK